MPGLDSRPNPTRPLRRLRLYQLLHRGVSALQMWRIKSRRSGGSLRRVAPEDYRANLAEIVELAKARGARCLLMTAPHNHAPGKVPGFFIDQGLASSEEQLIEDHRRYAGHHYPC